MINQKRVAKELLEQIWYSVPTPEVNIYKNLGIVAIDFELEDGSYIQIVVTTVAWSMAMGVGDYDLPEFDLYGTLDNAKLSDEQAWPYKTQLQYMARYSPVIPNTLHLLDD